MEKKTLTVFFKDNDGNSQSYEFKNIEHYGSHPNEGITHFHKKETLEGTYVELLCSINTNNFISCAFQLPGDIRL